MSRLSELIDELCPDGVEYKAVKQVAAIRNGRDHKHLADGDIPVYGSGGIMRYVDTASYDKPSVLLPRKGSLNNVFYVDTPFWNVDTVFHTVINEDVAIPRYFYYVMCQAHVENYGTEGARPSLTQSVLNDIRIPVPPIEVQREIVRILDSFQELDDVLTAEIEAREKQYRYAQERCFVKYFGDPAAIDESRHGVKLGDLYIVGSAKRVYQSEQAPEGVPFLRVSDLVSVIDGSPVVPDLYISDERFQELSEQGYVPSPGDILVTARGTLGRYYFISKGDRFYFQDGMITWLKRTDQSPSERYFAALFSNERFLEKLIANCGQGTVRYLSIKGLANTPVPKADAEELRLFDREMAEVDSLSQLTHELRSERDARRKQFEHYRDKLLAFPEKVA